MEYIFLAFGSALAAFLYWITVTEREYFFFTNDSLIHKLLLQRFGRAATAKYYGFFAILFALCIVGRLIFSALA
jgi:hypothetical protein